MLRKLRPRRPSHATVVAYLALFFALGGSAFAAFVVSSNSQIGPDTIYGANKPAAANDNVVNGSLTGADVRGNASPGFINGSLDTYDIRDKGLLGGDLADETVTAGQLAPNSVTKAKLAAPEAWQNVKPPDDSHCNSPDSGGYFFCFNNFGTVSAYWGNDSSTANNNAAYYKDPYGVVHLKGIICQTYSGCADSAFSGNETMLYLPFGYRPAKTSYFHTESTSGEALIVVRKTTGTIAGQGNVDLAHGNYAGVSLDGIEFRACGEPGSEAC